MRANHASRSSRVGKIFLFFGIVVSFEVTQNAPYADVDVGERAHHLKHFTTVDPLFLVHSKRMPTGMVGRKMAAPAVSPSGADQRVAGSASSRKPPASSSAAMRSSSGGCVWNRPERKAPGPLMERVGLSMKRWAVARSA